METTHVKPKRAMTAFLFFSKEQRPKVVESNPNKGFGDIQKLLGSMWRELSEDDKKTYKDLSAADQSRYKEEMKNYVPDPNAEAPRKKKRKKDPNAPKRGKSAFMFYSIEKRPKISKKKPELSFTEIAKFIGAEWKNLKPRTKKKYEKLAEADKLRYQQEMEAYVQV